MSYDYSSAKPHPHCADCKATGLCLDHYPWTPCPKVSLEILRDQLQVAILEEPPDEERFYRALTELMDLERSLVNDPLASEISKTNAQARTAWQDANPDL